MSTTTTPVAPSLGAGAYATTIGNEIGKGMRFAWSERLQVLIELPMFAAFILTLGPLIGQADQLAEGTATWTLDSETTTVMLVWFVPFTYFYMQVVKMFWRLLAEIQAGTIEQVLLSPMPGWLVVAAGRVLAALLESLFVAAASFGIVSIFVPVRIDWSAAALLPLAMGVLAAIGVSLIIAGATLVWKRIQLANDAVLMVVMLFSASGLALIDVPDWWATTGHFLPLTDVVASLHTALLTDEPVLHAWGLGGLVPMLVASFGYLAAGVLAFTLGARTARRRGTLSRY